MLVWSLADFFEGFIPLLIYRSLRIKPASKLKHPKVTYELTALLALDVVVSAVALVNIFKRKFFIATFIAGIAVLIAQAAIEDRKTWITWLIVGVFIASIVSGVFSVGALAAFGQNSHGDFLNSFLRLGLRRHNSAVNNRHHTDDCPHVLYSKDACLRSKVLLVA